MLKGYALELRQKAQEQFRLLAEACEEPISEKEVTVTVVLDSSNWTGRKFEGFTPPAVIVKRNLL